MRTMVRVKLFAATQRVGCRPGSGLFMRLAERGLHQGKRLFAVES